jgi:hypothetical protein
VAICLYRTVAEKGSGSDLQQVMAFDDQVTYGQPKPGQLSDTGPITTASSVVVQRFAITMDVTFEAVPGQSTFHPTKVGSKPPMTVTEVTPARPATPVATGYTGPRGPDVSTIKGRYKRLWADDTWILMVAALASLGLEYDVVNSHRKAFFPTYIF